MHDTYAQATLVNPVDFIRRMKDQGCRKVEAQESLRARGYSLAQACTLLRDHWNG